MKSGLFSKDSRFLSEGAAHYRISKQSIFRFEFHENLIKVEILSTCIVLLRGFFKKL